MKKVIKIIACGLILCAILASGVACKDKNEKGVENGPLKIAVLSDLHIMTEEEVGDPSYDSFIEYSLGKQTMLYLSEAIFKSAVDELIENKPDVVLFSGDLTQNGSKKSIDLVIEQFHKLEQAGIRVFTTSGTTDFAKDAVLCTESGIEEDESIEIEDFPVLFNDFGYAEAVSRDEDTFSYVVDLNDDYRLLVMEYASVYDYTYHRTRMIVDRMPEITEGTMDFIEKNMERAQDDKKEMLVLTYFPINNSVGDYIGYNTKRYVVAYKEHEYLEDMFSFYGTKYIFSGHMHTQNVLAIKDNQYGDLYDYTTGSVCCYPLPIRYFTETEEGLTEETKSLSGIREEYLPSYLTDAEKTAVTTDFLAFSKSYVKKAIFDRLESMLDYMGVENGNFLRILYGLEFFPSDDDIDINISRAANDPDAVEFGRRMRCIYDTTVNMPLYGENSVESRCLAHGRTMPKINYSTIGDFLAEVMCDIYSGAVHITSESDEAVAFRFMAYSMIEVALEQDLGEIFAKLDESVKYFDLTDIVTNVFETDILDLNDEEIVNMLTILNPLVKAKSSQLKLQVNFLSAEDFIRVVDTFLPIVVRFAAEYDAETDTIFGVPYTRYYKNGGFIYVGKLWDDVVIDIIAKDILY